MLRVVVLRQTCEACPSQWEGTLEDGRALYVRYRYGFLSFRLSPGPTEDVYDAVRGEEVWGQQVGDGLDGDMDTETMKKHALTVGIEV